jgi:hypothetical protein
MIRDFTYQSRKKNSMKRISQSFLEQEATLFLWNERLLTTFHGTNIEVSTFFGTKDYCSFITRDPNQISIKPVLDPN